MAFTHELKRSKRNCEQNFQDKVSITQQQPANPTRTDKRRKNAQKDHERVDGKEAFTITDPPDGYIETLSFADHDFFPSVRRLLVIGATSPVGSLDAERAASGVRRLKTPYRTTMKDVREGNLNLIQLQRIIPEIEVDKIIEIFKRMKPRRMFDYSVLFE